ncbi:hypothetical protein WBJ53_25980 [Spirosoma sp. SC4-14]|uniref:hypothetical protein n=1 Tax=Spirosoma sp. SC4-14 TaxID=3128900 RepID=UPI0030CC469A
MNTFEIHGNTFSDGDLFTIIAPELGYVEAAATRQEYGGGTVVGLTFGWIQTHLPCFYSKAGNARLSFYTNGQLYNTLQLAYFCSCPYDAHNHYLTWYDVKIDGNQIEAPSLGVHFNQPHNHRLHSAFDQQRSKPLPVVQPDPEVNSKGQFLLF